MSFVQGVENQTPNPPGPCPTCGAMVYGAMPFNVQGGAPHECKADAPSLVERGDGTVLIEIAEHFEEDTRWALADDYETSSLRVRTNKRWAALLRDVAARLSPSHPLRDSQPEVCAEGRAIRPLNYWPIHVDDNSTCKHGERDNG